MMDDFEPQKRKRCDFATDTATSDGDDSGYVAKKRPTIQLDVGKASSPIVQVEEAVAGNLNEGAIIEDESPASPEDGMGGMSEEGELDDEDDDSVDAASTTDLPASPVAVNHDLANVKAMTTTVEASCEISNENANIDPIIVKNMPTVEADCNAVASEASAAIIADVDPECGTSQSNLPLIRITYRDAATVDRLHSIVQHAIRRALFQQRISVEMQLLTADEHEPQFIVRESPVNGNDTNTEDGISFIGGRDIFIIDAEPTVALPQNATKSSAADIADDVPQYRVNVSAVYDPSTLQHGGVAEDSTNTNICRRPKNNCFNCDGDHTMRDCPEPRNAQKIRENRMQFNGGAAGGTGGRYHIDANQKFGHFVPGQLGDALRQALGLRDGDLPLHVYRMRVLGYPPGWLEAAQVTRSGLTLFGDTVGTEKGDAIGSAETGAEPEEIDYDLKKIHEYPGFNVEPEEGTFDISYNLRLPPMCESQSKTAMLQRLRSKSTKSYKRMKVIPNMALADADAIPVDTTNPSMDIDVDEPEDVEAVANPPIPGSEPNVPHKALDTETNINDSPSSPWEPTSALASKTMESSRSSPTMDDLKRQQEQLLAALDNSTQSVLDDSRSAETANAAEDSLIDDIMALDESQTTNDDSQMSTTQESNTVCVSPVPAAASHTNPTTSSTPLNSSKQSMSGTPLLQSTSTYTELPAGSNWSVGVSEIIDFENLADSTGKFERMKDLIKKVRVSVKQLNDEYDV